MGETQYKRPRQITVVAVLWLIFGLYNLWVAFQGISADLSGWSIISLSSITAWFKMAIPFELGLSIALLVTSLLQLITVPLLLIGKSYSTKLALGVFMTIAILNLTTGALYASAPVEYSSDFSSATIQAFGLGIFQIIMVVYFARDLNKPEVQNFMHRNAVHNSPEIDNLQNSSSTIPNMTVYCRYCGVENSSESSYCGKCGKSLTE
jgi:hypothetical protein